MEVQHLFSLCSSWLSRQQGALSKSPFRLFLHTVCCLPGQILLYLHVKFHEIIIFTFTWHLIRNDCAAVSNHDLVTRSCLQMSTGSTSIRMLLVRMCVLPRLCLDPACVMGNHVSIQSYGPVDLNAGAEMSIRMTDRIVCRLSE